jgi:hypothetical protein
MKMLLVVCLALISWSGFSQSQNIIISAGTTYSSIRDFNSGVGDQLGYYIGFGMQEKFDKVVGLTAEIQYIDQRFGIQDEPLSVKSLVIIWAVNLHVSDNFYFMVGPQFGQTVSQSYAGETLDQESEIMSNYVVGAAIQVNPRVTFMSRFVGPIDGNQGPFNYNVQLGAFYRIPTGH